MSEALHEAIRAQMVKMASEPPTPGSLRALAIAATAARDLLTAIQSPEAMLKWLPGGEEAPDAEPADAPPAETYGVSMLRQLLPQLAALASPKPQPPTVQDLLHTLSSARLNGAPPAVLASIQKQIEELAGASGEWIPSALDKPVDAFGLGVSAGAAAYLASTETETP